MPYQLDYPHRTLAGTVRLTGSKSISNRVLIIRALAEEPFPVHRLAKANDTQLMENLLSSREEVLDAGPAGTTFRFLTAYLAGKEGTQILTGSERMKQRPIGVLVDALRELGADIRYLEREGYPPLRIGNPDRFGSRNTLEIPAGTSSQYISALLMLAPTLPNGLSLTLTGKVVSRPYIEMTLNLMAYFGVQHFWKGNTIRIAPQPYRGRPITIEADWSAASYYYAMAAFSEETDLFLEGLFPDSVQGDAVLVEMMEAFGVHTIFTENGVHLNRKHDKLPDLFCWDFLRCPDLAQTLAVVCAGLGVRGIFNGLETLKIKETDRIAALRTELAKVGVELAPMAVAGAEDASGYYQVNGLAAVEGRPVFATYEDHRMAMALAPLALYGTIGIEDPEVVGKSYPDFWKDLENLGFTVKEMS